MDATFKSRKQKEAKAPKTEETGSRGGPSLEALRTGAAAPTREQMGRRVDLPDAMREKMEASFGADLSAVKLYESEAVEEAGANAVTRGADIAFAPGMLDFTSFGGQALLGHELSHVVSQARGEVAGGGFLNDASLEARADREGTMAAAGEQVSLPAAAVSGVSAASAAGPMQADKKESKLKKHQHRQAEAYDMMMSLRPHSKDYAKYERQYNDAMKWQRYWSGNKDLDASSNPELSGVSQLARAKQRHTGKNGLDEKGYFANAELILKKMSDQQLTSPSEAGFREQLVDEYSAYRGKQLAAGSGGDAFQPVKIATGGMLANLYSRMMGRDKIQERLTETNPDTAVARMAALADQSGALDLLARQHVGVYGEDSSREQQQATMRDFLTYSTMTSQPGGQALVNYRSIINSMKATPQEYLDQEPGNAMEMAMMNMDNPDAQLEDTTSAAYQNLLGPKLAALAQAKRRR